MKRKVLISFVGIALFAVAIGFGSTKEAKEEVNKLTVKNVEANADMTPWPAACGDPGFCVFASAMMETAWIYPDKENIE